MPQQSRYDDTHVESIMNEIYSLLDKKNANLDLSLMVLGNLVSDIIQQQVAANQREKIVSHFCSALNKAVTTR